MSEPPLKTFIPAWLDDAGLSLAEFRTYCNLVRRRGEDGIAWPSYEAMAKTCGLGRATVWRALKSLEDRGFIEKLGKGFGQSTRYRIPIAPNSFTAGTNAAPPIVSPQERLENGFASGTIGDSGVSPEERLDPNSFTTETNGSPPIVSQGNSNSSSNETPIVSPEEQEGYPKKGIQQKEEEAAAAGSGGLSIQKQAEKLMGAHPRPEFTRDALEAAVGCIERHAGQFTLDQIIQATKAYADAVRTWTEDEVYAYLTLAPNFFRNDGWRNHPDNWKSRKGARKRISEERQSFGRRQPTSFTDEEIAEALGVRGDGVAIAEVPSADYIVRCYPKKGSFAECLGIVTDHIAAGEDPSAMMAGVSAANRQFERQPSAVMSPAKYFRGKHWKTTPQADGVAPDVEAAMGNWG